MASADSSAPSAASALVARLRARAARALRSAGEVDCPPAVLSWLRTLSLEHDAFVVESPRGRRVLAFPFPSDPASRPVAREAPSDTEIRFVVRVGLPPSRSVAAPFRPVVSLGQLEILERDTPHGTLRPLRLGLSEAEAKVALAHVRASVARHVDPSQRQAPRAPQPQPPRLHQRASVGVALWTRGRLRGSVVSPAGSVLHTLGQAAEWACEDPRFERLSPADLDESVLQVSVLHAPLLQLSPGEIDAADAYADKGLFASEGVRSGVFLPEIFNVGGPRRLSALTARLAREKVGLAAVGPATRVEVCEVTEVIESADRARAVALEGPVARSGPFAPGDALADAARASGAAACAWLASLLGEGGALPLRVQASTGVAVGTDVARAAMTAHALAEVGVVCDLPAAVETARSVVAWVTRARSSDAASPNALLTACYLAKAALALPGLALARPFVDEVLAVLARSPRELPPLVASHALSLLARVAGETPAASAPLAALRDELEGRFEGALASGAPVSLAEWAELAMAPPVGERLSLRVRAWLVAQQLRSGAFPDTTASSFVYSRGTGKVFEVLAASRDARASENAACDAALGWLLGMQYRPDSAFFIPAEHRARLLGGLRHDAFDTDAWIDAAGHLLLGLARRAHAGTRP